MTQQRIPPPWEKKPEGAEATPSPPTQADPNRTAKGTFAPGNVAGAAGRPKGSKNVSTRMLEALKERADELLVVAINKALDGDPNMLSTLLGRMLPALRQRGERLQFRLDPKATLADQSASVLAAMAEGVLSPDEGQTVLACIASHARIVETTEIDERLRRLEAVGPRQEYGAGIVLQPMDHFKTQ